MRIDELKAGQVLSGIVPGKNVTLIAATPIGSNAMDVTYRLPDGSVSNQLLFDSEMSGIHLVSGSKYSFACDAATFQLVAEANRIKLAYLFDPYIAVHTSSIEPLPHQITAVYENMLQKHPLRYVLADDPGAGKTIMAGLLIKELLIRGDVKRCLVVAPGSIVEQWQDELFQKFNIRFDILTNDMLEGSVSGNAFEEHDLLIARLDKLSRNEDVQNKLSAAAEWDLVIIDEAHKLSASVMGNKVNYTKRYRLGQLLSQRARHFLLMTATPHNGKEADFQQFMCLVDPDRFQAHSGAVKTRSTYDDVMRRLVKEELLKFDGKPLFPERFATTISYELSEQEMDLYNDVTSYVRTQFNRAERLNDSKRAVVGFALTVLQRRLASSPEAIYQSLHRRRERLEDRLHGIAAASSYTASVSDDFDEDDYTEDELEHMEDSVLDESTAAATKEELTAEVLTLKDLEAKADAIRHSNRDEKWTQLSTLLQSPELTTPSGQREKIIIFTEHRDTLRYLEGKIKTLLGSNDAVLTIHGSLSRDDRRDVQNKFRQDKDVTVLIATDAAGEGINLQRAHLMVNYDLPWNPNRIEQRFGRIHRIGQKNICHLWNLIAKGTREGDVFSSLFLKLEEERTALGGKVFDVLGKLSFDNKPLRDILIEAIRTDNEPQHREYINRVVNAALDTKHLQELLSSYALTNEVMDANAVFKIKEQMERMEARRLQPYYVQDFFEKAFSLAGGYYHKREANRFEITRVPQSIQTALPSARWGNKVLKQYERITFVREGVSMDGKPDADLICPGHPLLDSLIAWVEKNFSDEYNKGGILVDPQSRSDQPRLLCCLDTSIRDAVQIDGSNRIVARQMSYVEIHKDGTASNAGFAPYLDYCGIPDGKLTKTREIIRSETWMSFDVENIAVRHAVSSIIPELFAETKGYRTDTIDKIKHEVRSRLQAEINYWDRKAGEYRDKINRGDANPATPLHLREAENKANELDARRKRRLEELDLEMQMAPMPPVLNSVALIIPQSMLMETAQAETMYGTDRDAVEKAAMDAVLDIEKNLGFVTNDVSSLNCGYDIESVIPESMRTESVLRCIEVKGRSKDHAGTVTLSRNELNTALNIPQQFILALVTVDGDRTTTTYCMNCFSDRFDPAANCVTFDTQKLIEKSTVIYDERTDR